MKKIIPVLFVSLLSSNTLLADNRIALKVSAEHRDMLLKEMRQLLHSSQQVLEGIVNNDMQQVEQAARQSGMNMAQGTPPEVARILPQDFKVMGPSVHRGFEQIADEADGFGDTQKILKTLAQTQTNCVACHEIYRFEVKQ